MKRVLLTTLLFTTIFSLRAQTIYYSLIPEFSTAEENSLSLSLSSVESTATDIEFSNDGTKLFVMGSSSDAIYDYTLTTAFDITTASSSGTFLSVSAQDVNPQGFVFNQDGTKLFMLGAGSGAVNEYDLSTAFDLSTATATGTSFTVSTQDTAPTGIDFNPEGDKMYIIGTTGDSIYEYDLATNFDISSAVYNNVSFSVVSQSTNPSDLELSPDGKFAFVLDATSNELFSYEMDTVHQISTASLFDELSLSNSSSNTGFAFSKDFRTVATINSSSSLTDLDFGSTAFKESSENNGTLEGSIVVLLVGDTLVNDGEELEITTHYSIDNLISGFTPVLSVDSSGFSATLTFTGRTTSDQDTLDISSVQFTFTDAAFKTSTASSVTNATGPAESNLGVDLNAGFNQPEVFYSLVPVISEATSSGSSISPSNDSGYPDFAFSADGTKIFILGTGDVIYQYTLSTAFDISSATDSEVSFSVSSEDTAPVGLQFDNSGGRLYVLGSVNDAIFQYDLTTTFDLSTASYSGTSLSVSTYDTSPAGFTFSGSGDRLFLTGNTGRTLDQLELANAFNINSVTSSSTLSLTSTNTYNSIQFSADGKTFYVGTTSSIIQYDLLEAFDISGATTAGTLSLTSNTAFRFNSSFTELVTLSSGLSLNEYDLTTNAFEETQDNDGQVEGLLIARIRRGTFSSTLTADDVTIAGVPSGFTAAIALGDDFQNLSITLSGQTESNDLSNSVSDIQISFADASFEDLVASEVTNAADAQTGLGISFISGSNIPQPYINYSKLPNIANVSDTVTQSLSISDITGFVFNDDGSRLYALDITNVSEYLLSINYDVSTATLNHQLSISSQETGARGLAINSIGTRLFVIGSTREINIYRFSLAYDLSTATFDSVVTTITDDSSPTDIAFNDDGSKMYILGDTNNSLYEYFLSTAFDPSSATLENTLSLGALTGPQGLSFTQDGSSFFLVDNSQTRFYQYDLTTPFDVSTGTAKLINVSISSELTNPSAIQLSGDGKSLLISGTTSDKVCQYSFPAVGFIESSANDGALEGRIIGRIVGDTFTNAGSTFTQGDQLTISDVPVGIDPVINVSSSGLVLTVDYDGNALDNDTTDIVDNIAIDFTDEVFTSSTTSEVSTSSGGNDTGLGIEYIAGSELVLDVELVENNDVINDLALEGNTLTVFSWKTTAGTDTTVVDTVTVNASYVFGSILTDFTLSVGSNADGSDRTQLSPETISVTDSLVSFQNISDTLTIIEEVYYFVNATTSGVNTSTASINFALGSTNFLVTGPSVTSATVTGSTINFTDLAFTTIQDGIVDSIAYGETKLMDVDNDDDLDIIAAGRDNDGNNILKYYTNAAGIVSSGISFGTAKDSVRLAPGDFDNDLSSEIDLLVQGYVTDNNGATLYNNNDLTNAKEFDTDGGNLVNGDVASGDFDGDGDLDMIITGHEDTDATSLKIRIFRNDRDDTYTLIDTLSNMTAVIYGDIEVGDIDNDGDLDVFITGLNSSGSPVAELHLNGATGFIASASSFTAVSRSAADFGDFNGDGYLDLVVSGTTDGTDANVSSVIYTNGGDGSFTASSIAIDNNHSGDVKWIDLDNDGDADLVQTGITDTGREASVWINDGTTLNEAYAGNITGLSNGNISYGDLDGDNDLDLVVNGYNGSAKFVTSIYENALYSGFVTEVAEPDSIGITIEDTKFIIGWDSLAGAQYEVIVVKTDSLQEVEITRSADSRRLNGFVRNPEKARLRNTTYEINDVERAAYRIGVQRVNSIAKGSEFIRIESFFNGTPYTPIANSATDLTSNSFTANWSAQAAIDSFTVTLVREETISGEETLVDVGTFSTSENSYDFTNLRRNRNYRYTVKAFNGTLESASSNEIRVILPISSLFIATNVTGLSEDAYEALELGDFDDDDDLDIVASTGTSSFVLLNGSSTSIDLGAARSTSSLEVFDFGNDGDQDIFMTGTANGAGVTSFFQNTSATFAETITNSSQFLEAKITSGDVDNDGDVDVVLMGRTSSSVETEVLINNGTNFDSLSQEFIADTQGDFGLTDFDLDGDLDLLILGVSEATLYVNESGTFSEGSARTFDFLSDVDMELADMTGDGRPDVVYTGVSDGNSLLKIYSTNDTLGFVKITDMDVTSLSSSAPEIELLDGDNDGMVDVFLVGTESMEVYSNTTNGVLTETEAITINIAGVSSPETAFGDYDNDGDVDLLFSGVNSASSEDVALLSNANDTGNDSPSAPTNLDITFPTGNWLLQWDPSSDDKTASDELTYNVLIESTTEALVYQSANPDNGFRKVSGFGDIQDTIWAYNPVNLPIGDYTWKVQAIDANGQGSVFSAASPLAVPDTVKIFNNQPAIDSGEIDGGTEDVVFFSFGINSTDDSTLDSIAFNLSADYREYLRESTFKVFRSVDSNPDLSPEDQVVDAQASSDGSTLSISGLSNSLSQQQVYFFLVAQAKFVAEAGTFQVTLNSSNVFLQESGFVNEVNSFTGPLISIRNAVTTFTPGIVSVDNFEASAENAGIMVFSANANVTGVRLQGLNISGSSSISDKFENIRVFSSTDNSFDAGTDTELGTFTVDGNNMTVEFSSQLPGGNTDLFYFVVADILSSVSQSTASISLTLNSPADLTFSSTELNTLDFTTGEYTFYFDLIPPTVRYDTFDENVRQGSGPHSVSFTVQDQFEITSVNFFWRKLAESNFQQVSQTVNSNGSYSFEFSASDIGSVGVEFYAAATDLDGNTNDPEVRSIGIFFDSTDPIDFKSEANIKLEGESVTDYSLISFPFQSGRFSDVLSGLEDAKHGGLAELFAGDDNTKYRIVGMRGGASDASGFQELTLGSTYSPGSGYYLIVGVKEADIQVVSAETVEASSDNPHAISLSAGWNMIGNPYLFPISIESIRDYNLAVGNITDASVINDFRLFKNGQFVANPSTMERFDGAFIRVTENVSNFEFPMNDEIPSSSGGRVELTRWDEVVSEDSWRLDLTIKQGNQLSIGGFGIKEDAENGEDIYDQYVLPAPGDYIRLQHEIDNELSVIRNAVKSPDLANVWNTSLHAVRDGRISLEWDHELVQGLARSLYLFDPVGLRFIDMKSTDETSVSVSKGANELLFFYGPEDLKEEVLADHVVAVGQVYPNPVTDVIGLNLIGQADTEIVVALFDINGKEVLSTEDVLKTTGVSTLNIAIDSQLRSGLYFLEVQVFSDQGVYRSKQKILIND